jgi:hypothetical protein
VYNRTFKWLWANRREDVLRWNNEIEPDGRIAGPGRIGRWDRLDDEHYLQMGLCYWYLLGIVQEVLEALALADEVHVVYAHADEQGAGGRPSMTSRCRFVAAPATAPTLRQAPDLA